MNSDGTRTGRVVLKRIPLRAHRFSQWPQLVNRILLAVFFLGFALVSLRLAMPLFGDANWPEGLLLVLAAASTLASLSCQLPAQNVMLAGIIITVMAGAAHTLSVLTGIPFGPCAYAPMIGQQLYPVPWAMPLLWLVVILNARGVSRLVLRRFRQRKDYGLWLIGLTTLLVVLFDFALEPFATQYKHYWRWIPSRASLLWYGAPWVNFFAWAVTALLILAFVTPSLINKKPVKPVSPPYQPLVIWLAVNLLFAAAAFSQHLIPAAAVGVVGILVVTTFALQR